MLEFEIELDIAQARSVITSLDHAVDMVNQE